MAKMIPANPIFASKSKAEERVFHVLQDSLDDGCCVFHSFDVLAHNLENKLVDAELDFLIFCPHQGILVLEVKGGSIEYDGAQAQWLQNGHPLKESPYHQAKRNKYSLLTYLQERLGKPINTPIGHAVCFPDVFAPITVLPAEADERITFTGSILSYLAEAVMAAMEANRKDYSRPPEHREAELVRQALMPVFEYGTGLADMMGRAKECFFRLTEEQCALLNFISRRKRVLVEGGAGTGKTVIALKKARELALAGKKVLLLCFNRPLGEQLKESSRAITGDITVATYHAFCIQALQNGGVEIVVPEDNNTFWRTELPERLDQFLNKNPLRYDAIIVDEGQDFLTEYWLTIERMLDPEGYFYIFYDPQQNLYGSDLQFPFDDEPFVLETNCRNTRQICSALQKFSHNPIAVKEGTPEGLPVTEVSCSSDHESRKELSRILHTLVNEEGLAPQDIVVIGAHSFQHTWLAHNNRAGNFLIESDPQTDLRSIRYYTYMRFKGCESDAVIVIDVGPKDPRWSDPGSLYTAMSRAKVLLYVLHRKN
nr:NERD domain-containing protein [Deltaproteobacteria bacterium]